jgi:hypothetical protein
MFLSRCVLDSDQHDLARDHRELSFERAEPTLHQASTKTTKTRGRNLNGTVARIHKSVGIAAGHQQILATIGARTTSTVQMMDGIKNDKAVFMTETRIREEVMEMKGEEAVKFTKNVVEATRSKADVVVTESKIPEVLGRIQIVE